MAESYSIVQLHHIIHLSTDEHVSGFHILTT
jgi:hypothetical protein